MEDFFLDEEHRLVRDAVARFCEDKIEPKAREIEEEGRFPVWLIPELADVGLTGMSIPEEYGGAGMDTLGVAVAVEELAKASASVALSMAAHNSLCLGHIFSSGSEGQKEEYGRPLATGQYVGAWSLTEPEAGSDAGSLKSEARLEGEEWVLEGHKVFTTNGSIADVLVVMAKARVDGEDRGITAFIVEGDSEGLEVVKDEDKMGLKASPTSELLLDGVRVGSENVLGGVGDGYTEALEVLSGGRVGIAAFSVGIAQASYEAAVGYSKERRQFGEPISSFQGVSFRLADMATKIEAARLLTLQAASLKDSGRPFRKESSMAKLFASEVAMHCAWAAVQVHGGYGYIKDYPVERYFRDARICEIGEGTSEVQRMIIAKEVLGGNI